MTEKNPKSDKPTTAQGVGVKPMVIYRCGWCGLPVNKDGSLIDGINDNIDADKYLEKNRDAIVHNVNGVCCRGGDE